MKKLCTFKSLTQGVKGLLAVMLITIMALGNVLAQSQEYQLVNEDQADWSGTYLLVATNGSTQVALSGFTTSGAIVGTYASVADYVTGSGITSNATTDGYQVTIAKTVNNTYTMTFNGEYLGWISGNTLAHSATAAGNNQYEWNIYFDGGNLRIANVNTPTRMLQWNASSPRFACYGNTGQIPCQLYKLATVNPDAVATPIFTPVAGFYYATQTVAIATSTADAIIYYTTDGTTPDATSAVYTSPITVSTNATIKAIAMVGENESFVATANYSFPTVKTSVSALKADGVNNEIYKLNAALRVIYQNGQYLFVQDGTGALLIYGNAGKTYEEGDYIYNGIYGKFSPYNGMNELAVVAGAPDMADGEAGDPVKPIVVTIADLVANYAQYESKLVTIKDVTFTGGNNFAQGDDAISFYNRFNTSFNIAAGSLGNVTGLVAKNNSNVQIYPRSNKDIEVAATLPVVVDFDDNAADGWLIDNGDCVNEWYIGQAQGFDNYKLYISSTNGATNKYDNATSDVTFSRLINVPASGAVLSFDFRGNGQANYDYLKVMLDGQVLGTFAQNIDWVTNTIDIAPEMAGAHVLTFEWVNNNSIANQFAAAIDNINIVPVTCTQPANLTATVNGTTANITWMAPADQSAWTVEYKLSNHTEWYSMNVTTPSITLSDLQGNSTYDVRVKANCGDDNSVWTNGTFNVECQNLDVTVASEDVTIGTGTSTQSFLFDGLYGFGYSVNLYTMENAGAINSIAFDLSSASTTTGASVDMWVKAVPADYALSSSNTFNQMLDGAQQIASGVSDFTSAGWKVFNINGGFELGEGQNLLVLTRSRGCSLSGGCSKSVRYTSATDKVWYKRADNNDPGQSVSGSLSSNLPNIKINMDVVTTICGDVEACPAVTDVTISNVTPQGAEVAWNAEASQNAFIVEYKTAGASVWNTINVNDANSVVLSGLMQLTDYVVKVKANCGTNNLSEPVVATFATTGICPIVSNIDHANNSNATTLTWTAGGSENAWIIQFKPVAADDNAWVTINASIVPMTTFGGLQGSTDYEVRIKAICDPDDTENQSAWVYYYFLSGCAAYDVPFAETFSSRNEPDCWSSVGFDFDGYQAITNDDDCWLMTPPVNIPSGTTNYLVSFDVIPMGNYSLLASDRGSALARFTPIYNGTSADGRVIVALPESYKGKMVYFMLSNNGQSFVSVDNFKITECPYIPTNLTVTNITDNSISLTWECNPAVNYWTVEYSTDGQTWSNFNSAVTSATITGLNSNTNYKIRVISACGANVAGDPSNVLTATTACALYDLPYAEDFEGFTSSTSWSSSVMPDCWEAYKEGTSTSYYPSIYRSSSYAHSGMQAARFYNYCTASSQTSTTYGYQYMVLPKFNVSNPSALMINGWARRYSTTISSSYTSDVTVGVSTDLNDVMGTFTPVTHITAASASYEQFSIDLGAYNGPDGYIVFFVDRPSGTPSYNTICIDDIVVDLAPTCFPVSALTASVVADVYATLSWNDSREQGGYVIAYRPVGETEWSYANANSTSFTLTNLSASTTYEAMVKAACSDNTESEYTNVITFTTTCLGGLHAEIGNGTTGSSYLPSYSLYNYTLSEEIYNAAEIGAAGPIAEISIYNQGSAKTRTYDIYLKHTSQSTFSSGTNWIPVSSSDKVFSGSVTMDANAWTTITLDNTFNFNGSDNVVLVFDDNTGSYLSGLSGRCTSQSEYKSLYIYSDGVNYNPSSPSSYSGTRSYSRLNVIFNGCREACPAPRNVNVDDIALTTAEVSWTAGGEETAWNVEYGPAGFAQGEGTVVAATSNPFTLSGLTPSTAYDVYVQADCGAGEVSEWVSGGQFSTLCENSCSYTLNLNDSYGDGWNDAYVNVYEQGYLIGSYTISSGLESSETVITCGGEITFTWTPGLYNYECSFTIADAEGNVLYSCTDGSTLSSDQIIYSTYCGEIPTCFAPTGLAASNVTSATADLAWTPTNGETNFVVEYAENGTDNWIAVPVSGTSTTLTNLMGGTQYSVRVKADCGGGDESDYTDAITILTPCFGGAEVALTDGSTYSYLPFYGYYGYGYSQQIYDAAELGASGEITEISFFCTAAPASAAGNIRIWMGNTNKSTFDSNNDFADPSTLTEVAYLPGQFNFTQGWNTIILNQPFSYDGTSNLIIAYYEGMEGYASSQFNAHETDAHMSLIVYADAESSVSYTNPASSTGTKSWANYRSDIKFSICPKGTDLAVESVVESADACEVNAPVTITVMNNGVLAPISTFDAYYSLNGGAEVHEVVNLSTPLAYRASTTYTFNAVPVYQLGSNVVNVRVEIAGDENAFNDNLSSTVTMLAPQDVPYFENFSGVTVNHGWNPVDANNDGITMGINNAITYSFNDAMAADDWMFSPCLNLPAGTYNVSFDYAGNSSLEESFSLWYGAAANVVNMTNLVANQTVNSTATNNYTGTIVVAQDGVYNFGFHAQSAAGNLGFSIDNFSITPMVEVNVIAGNNGSVSPAGNVSVSYNDDLVLSIIPDEMYHVGGIWVDGVQVMNEDPFNANFMLYTLENVTTPHTVNVEFKLEFHIIKSVENLNPAYTDVPGYFIPAATDTLIDPNPFTVTFAAAPHYHLTALELGAMSLDNPTDVSENVIDNGNGTYSYVIDTLVVANYYVNAIFARDTVNIHYNILTGQGTVDASPNLVAPAQYDTWVDYDVMNDLTETINIVPASNYHVVNVNINGQDMGAISTYSFTNIHETQNVAVKFGYQVNASIRNYVNEYLGSNDVRGIIAPATQLVPEFDPMTVTGTIENHFHLYNFFVNGVDRIDEVVFDDNNFSFTIPSVEDNYDIEAVVKIDTFGIHYTILGGDGTIDGNDVVAGSNMVTIINYGDSFLSTIEPAPGYHIESVTIDGVNYGNINTWRYEFISGHHYVTVVYAPNTIVINTTAYGVGTVTPGETFLYDPAHTYTFTATPAEGYHIESLLHNDEEVVLADPEAAYTETLTNIVENHTYVALFAMNTYNITATAGANGTVSPAGVTAYNYGADATYDINAEVGYYISSVTVDGNTVNFTQADAMNNTTISFSNITEGHTVAATFAQYQYMITVNAGANGTITPATAVYAFGATPSFDITPNAGYGIVDVTVDGESVGAVENYTFTALEANHTIAATFAQYQFTITATAGSNGTITPSGVTNMIYNGNQTYSIAAAAGYHIQDVFVDGVSVGAVTSYSFTGVTANHTIHAMFAADEYTITVNQPAHGTITPGTITVTYGATPTFVITPATGYSVATITLNGTNVINAATNVNGVYTYTLPAVSANATLTATMNAITYTINATAGANGTIAPAGVSTVNYGANKAYTITPANGYVVDQVTVDGINMGAIGAYTFVNVVANHTIHATFKYAECEVPTNLHVINVDTTSATLTWYHPGANSFDIQYKALDAATYTIISAVTGNSYELTDLQPNTSYVWNITANCVAGNHSETSNGNIFTTLALPVPAPIDTTGVENYVQNLIKVYGVVNNIYVVNDNNVNISNIQVYDVYGQLLYNGQANSNPEVISMNVAAGTYMVRLVTDKGVCNYKLYLRK